MIELYRGSLNTWECDEMGHMNVRFYVAKMMEGLGVFAHAMGMPQAFKPNAASTLLPRDQHIRFLNEVRPGQPIHMRGGVLDLTDSEFLLYQELIHTNSGKTAATYRTWITHAEADSGRAFPWNSKTLTHLDRLRVEADPIVGPRSVDVDAPILSDSEISIAIPEKLGISPIGCGTVPTQDCDALGRMRADMFMGRLSDSVPNLLAKWRDDVRRVAESKSGAPMKSGGAVLEYRLIYRHWPRAGDLFEVRSGLGKVHEKVHGLIHWVLDPISGKAWCTAEAIAVTFDLETRKIIPTDPKMMALLERHAVQGLKL